MATRSVSDSFRWMWKGALWLCDCGRGCGRDRGESASTHAKIGNANSCKETARWGGLTHWSAYSQPLEQGLGEDKPYRRSYAIQGKVHSNVK